MSQRSPMSTTTKLTPQNILCCSDTGGSGGGPDRRCIRPVAAPRWLVGGRRYMARNA
jgi:hypothetical protein